MKLREARAYRHKIEGAASSQTDEQALENIDLFPHWQADEDVVKDYRCQDEGILYKCIQPHHTQADWKPKDTPALWKKVSVEEFPEWVKPTGGHDAYNKGDKVTFQSEHYISTIDGNVWSPVEYPQGWQKVS